MHQHYSYWLFVKDLIDLGQKHQVTIVFQSRQLKEPWAHIPFNLPETMNIGFIFPKSMLINNDVESKPKSNWKIRLIKFIESL